MIQHLILEDNTTTYNVLVESNSESLIRCMDDDYSSYNPNVQRGALPNNYQPQISPELRVNFADVHHTIQGYTQYAIGAFKNLAITEVEEITLRFNLKISTEGMLPMIASGKAKSDFAIEVKCTFPKTHTLD